MYGSKHVWLLGSTYQSSWWWSDAPWHSSIITSSKDPINKIINNINGSQQQQQQLLLRNDDEADVVACDFRAMNLVVQNVINTDFTELSTDHNAITVSGLEQQQQQKPANRLHGYAYDGIWAIALAINNHIRNRNVNFSDQKLFRTQDFRDEMDRIDFIGVTGRVKFRSGERIGTVTLTQIQGRNIVHVGHVDILNDQLKLNGHLMWHDSIPPKDRSHITMKLQSISTTVYACVCVLVAAGVLLSIAFFTLNVRYKSHVLVAMVVCLWW
ncbi:hypothetical protein HELRODRAFT_164600 [Helobdella robusta]|uniref:Receptor ligand binding region domain-containing protein n=1 Tax=Helobdella robusta TaxID=6412 RepID=T1EVM4_HELRO|nr:hypothetical protein HELRODRAFT_164600 [Helobdella robusta]ESN94713.1 hypothetical protein HELRODRAFT_164600 [Helobdella robusta]